MINGNEVIVRQAGHQTDIDGLVARSSALFAEDAGARDPGVDINWPRKHGPQRFSSGLTDPSRLLLVADGDDGEVVGCLAGALVEPSAMKRVKVATLVSRYCATRIPARSDRRTHGRRIPGLARNRHQIAQVTACATNAEAIRFYERNGFASQSVTLGSGSVTGVTETLEHGTPQGNTASQLRYTDPPRLRERQHLRHAPNLHNRVRRRPPCSP